MRILSLFLILLLTVNSFALSLRAVNNEQEYNQIYSRIISENTIASDYQSSFFLKALSEAFDNNLLDKISLQKEFNNYSQQSTFEDKIIAAWTFRKALPDQWLQTEKVLQDYQGNDSRILHLINRKRVDLRVNREDLARDLIQDQPDMGVLRLYMFCRNERKYPCLFVARDKDGHFVTESNKVWSQPSLGFSRHGKLFNEFNGNTPSGVFSIQGVMPYANGQEFYGKFRRLILEFIPQSKSENALLNLLPSSSHDDDWWQESVIARDMGRSLFRIHGTGQQAPVGEPYYPFFGTSGCIAQRENTYEGVDYIDQRKLLDRLMLSLGLQPIFENETGIEALLYVINLNGDQRAVTLQDLEDLKIVENRK